MKKHGFVFLARVSTPLPFLLLKCLKICVSKNPFFPLGYEASADGSGSLQARFFVSACRSSLTLH